ncbi:MAG TPA: diguanylate cyclase [Terriglobales bacterium]|nr:diguanylate cyclase [Terriglobales bacterium]
MQPYTPERRQELSREVRALSSRDLQLWSLGFMVMLVLASGILCFLLPNARASVKLELRYVPQLSMGLIAMVLLLNFYLIDKRRELDKSRRQIIRDLVLDEGFDRFAVLDPVTQVFRRTHLHQVLDRELRRANREGVPVTLLMVKHRCIRKLATLYGGATADAFVSEVAQVLQQNFRGSDRIIRYSDSEFLVVLTGTNGRQAQTACARLQEYVDRWNLHTDMQWEMCLTTAAGEYHPGSGPFELIASLCDRVAELAAACEQSEAAIEQAFPATAGV